MYKIHGLEFHSQKTRKNFSFLYFGEKRKDSRDFGENKRRKNWYTPVEWSPYRVKLSAEKEKPTPAVESKNKKFASARKNQK